MIDRVLIEEYRFRMGSLGFTLTLIGPDDEERVEQMMREVIEGRRPPLTDADLGLSIPPEAES